MIRISIARFFERLRNMVPRWRTSTPTTHTHRAGRHDSTVSPRLGVGRRHTARRPMRL